MASPGFRRLLIVAAAVSALATACAKTPPRLDPTPGIVLTGDLVTADRLVRAGCYTCLKEALGIYERLSTAEAGGGVAHLRAVDTALLMAIRERELGLGQGGARRHAQDLTANLPAVFDYSTYLDIVDAVGWKANGVSAERQDSIVGGFRTVNQRFNGWRTTLLARAPGDLLGAYALTTLDCLYAYRLNEAKQMAWPLPENAPPLLRFRKAICAGANAADLDAVVKDEPRLKDAYLFLGERSLGQGRLRTAERQLTTALGDIPDLMAAKLLLGFVAFQMEEFEPARIQYHAVVAAVPGQRDAMLGEAKSLSYLGRPDEAIAVLDEMVRLGTWFQGDAHYWIAWNRHRLKQYDQAMDEVEAARKLMPMDPNVDKLAGVVALARNEVERAEREFRTALQHFAGRQVRDCDTGYYLASVLVMQKEWTEGGARFEAAMPCYVENEEEVRKRIEEIKSADLPDERKARLVAAKEKQVPVLQEQQARAAYNAAVAYANLGDKGKARPLAERAAQHPELADLAQKLLIRLQ